jgi:hypothetical protein
MQLDKKIAVGLGILTTTTKSQTNFTQKTNKTFSILKLLYEGKSLNRFEAELHNDHCLNSTISSIGRYGVLICREWERVSCLGGSATCKVKRYWLEPSLENLARTQKTLKSMEHSND